MDIRNNEKANNNIMSAPENINILIEIMEGIKERLNIRTSSYLRKSNKYFLDYDKDWSLVWFINKFIINLKWNEDKVDKVMLVKLYEETKDELFIDLLEYRIISKSIKKLKVNKEIVDNMSTVNVNLQKDTRERIVISDDEIEEIYL